MQTTKDQGLIDRVELALEEIRPFLISDGGNIKLVDIDGDRHEMVIKLIQRPDQNLK